VSGRLDWVLVRLGRAYPERVIRWLVARVMTLPPRTGGAEHVEAEGHVVGAWAWSTFPAARVLDFLAQLRCESVERVVIEALELLLVPPTSTDPDNTTDNTGILGGLVMLAQECPRLVSSCAPAVVDKLCTPGFLESAFRAHAASRIASERAAGGKAWDLRQLAALFLQRAPLLQGEQLRALIALVTPTGILRPPPRLAAPNPCAPGPPIVTMNGSVAVGGDEVHNHEPAMGGGGGQQEGVPFQRLHLWSRDPFLLPGLPAPQRL
jgi:hypothetical protein